MSRVQHSPAHPAASPAVMSWAAKRAHDWHSGWVAAQQERLRLPEAGAVVPQCRECATQGRACQAAFCCAPVWHHRVVQGAARPPSSAASRSLPAHALVPAVALASHRIRQGNQWGWWGGSWRGKCDDTQAKPSPTPTTGQPANKEGTSQSDKPRASSSRLVRPRSGWWSWVVCDVKRRQTGPRQWISR